MDQIINGMLWGLGFVGSCGVIFVALLFVILGIIMIIGWAERKGW